ncbi:MAG: aspartate kinase [Simkaniaceae bacterium]|nr:aspartate kinase [Simkaniaceae bacterium]
MIVMKFGGSSQSSAERLRALSHLVRIRPSIVVLSAIGKTTDYLLEAGEKTQLGKVDYLDIFALHNQIMQDLGIQVLAVIDLFKELEEYLELLKRNACFGKKERDHLVSFGERLSVRLFAAYLNSLGITAHFYDAWDLGVITTEEFGNGELMPHAEIKVPLDQGIPIVTGFIGKTEKGEITTLGRGGSDLTASYLAEALHAEEIWLWKDVDGVMTADPRLIKKARLIEELSFDEVAEMSYFGAKVFHPRSILPAMRANIPVRVKNSYYPERRGTTVVASCSVPPVRAIAHKSRQVLVKLKSTRMLGYYGFLSKIFKVFEDLKISVDVIATSEVSVSMTIDEEHPQLKERLSEFATVQIMRERTLLTLVGKNSTEVLEKALAVLLKQDIEVEMISHGPSTLNISLIVAGDFTIALSALHTLFFEGEKK